MDANQRYLFDVQGFVVLENQLDVQLLNEINAAIDAHPDRIGSTDFPLSAGASAFTERARRREFDDALAWLAPNRNPFWRLLTLPSIMRLMLDLIGDGFRLDSMMGTLMEPSTEGFVLHGGGGDPDSLARYAVVDGKIRNNLVTVSYALTDVEPGRGGFACIPGSHKANFPCPASLRRLEPGGGHALQIPVGAGSALVFSEALIHGTLPWTGCTERRTLFVRYSPGAVSFRRDVENVHHRGIDRSMLTPLQNAVVEPAYYLGRPSITELLRTADADSDEC
jgi:ectoine hydroxylase-related dioxygenase (phytanoyl-CoA dioxygenase family)